MNQKNAFPKVRLTQLIDEASREIANEEIKIEFHELMSKEIHAIGYDPSKKSMISFLTHISGVPFGRHHNRRLAASLRRSD